MSPLKRTKPLRARKPMKRARPITRVNRARRAKRSLEQYGTKEFREWIHAQPCALWRFCPMDRDDDPGPIEQAHVKSRARGGTWKDTIPLRRRLHRELHAIGRARFEKRYGVDLDWFVALTQTQWFVHRGPDGNIR